MNKNKKTRIELRDLEESFQLQELDNGIIRIDEEICDYTTTSISRHIDYVINSGRKHITFRITSPGGDVYSSLALYDIILGLNSKGVKTTAIVEGLAASAASMVLLQAMDNRYSRPTARFLIHEPRRWAFLERQKTSDLKDETQEMVAVTNVIYEILAKRCKKPIKFIDESIDRRERWLSANEAKEYGLIDKIIN